MEFFRRTRAKKFRNPFGFQHAFCAIQLSLSRPRSPEASSSAHPASPVLRTCPWMEFKYVVAERKRHTETICIIMPCLLEREQ